MWTTASSQGTKTSFDKVLSERIYLPTL